jgi:PIN domain
MNRMQYIFVDFENVHEVDLDLVAGRDVVVHLVLGERQKTLPLEMVERLMKYPAQVRLVKAGKSGKNALDFVLAYRVGVESVADPKGYYHIVSHDTGFDTLILHLRKHHILARRDESFAKAFDLGEIPPGTAADRAKIVAARLTKNKTARPKRKKTLVSQINAYFGKKLTEQELEEIVKTLIADHVIELGPKGEVAYQAAVQ